MPSKKPIKAQVERAGGLVERPEVSEGTAFGEISPEFEDLVRLQSAPSAPINQVPIHQFVPYLRCYQCFLVSWPLTTEDTIVS